MRNFCTNCGHENQQGHQICVECGKSLTEQKTTVQMPEKASLPKTNRKPLSMKQKILAASGILILASLIGVYSWGTKAASADSVVSKFFEALHQEDAKTLAKQVVLSDRGPMTLKEAEAFIRMYGDITPEELETMAKVEKNGKVIGVIDAHKIIFPTQKVSFDFPYEGLTLTLNGEKVSKAKSIEGEYTFWDLSPGFYDAEFSYEGEFAELTYPFELLVELQGDSSWVAPIYEELPVGTAMFELETYNSEDADANKILIGDKEVPVGKDQLSEEVGPLLFDGSVVAQAEVSFPWGKQLSEPVEITSGYHTIRISDLEKQQQDALIKQLTVFAEEYAEAYGKRDASVFSTVAKEQLEIFSNDFGTMKSYDEYFQGSVTEVGVDEESIQISNDGRSVNVDAELVFEGANYNKSETPSVDTIVKSASITFIYDQTEKKWLIAAFNDDQWFFDVTPTLTIEGSQKVYNAAGTTEKTEENTDEKASEKAKESVPADFNEEALKTFISDFRSAYEKSLNDKDFSLIDEFLLEGSIARKELVDFIGDIGNDYYLYEFIQDQVIEVDIQKDKAFVTTYEKFDFTNHLNAVTNYERNKRYEILLNDKGQHKISKINILDTVKEN